MIAFSIVCTLQPLSGGCPSQPEYAFLSWMEAPGKKLRSPEMLTEKQKEQRETLYQDPLEPARVSQIKATNPKQVTAFIQAALTIV
ncbi:MAG: hypothetical protein ACKV2V_06160 [Blastocatellia bacterium]